MIWGENPLFSETSSWLDGGFSRSFFPKKIQPETGTKKPPYFDQPGVWSTTFSTGSRSLQFGTWKRGTPWRGEVSFKTLLVWLFSFATAEGLQVVEQMGETRRLKSNTVAETMWNQQPSIFLLSLVNAASVIITWFFFAEMSQKEDLPMRCVSIQELYSPWNQQPFKHLNFWDSAHFQVLLFCQGGSIRSEGSPTLTQMMRCSMRCMRFLLLLYENP